MKKMKTIQKTWGLLLTMAAALALTACNSDDKTTEAPPAPSCQQGEVKTIPYSVTVGGDEAAMRATVDADLKTLRFAAGDQLYISASGRDDVQAVLTLKAGGEGQTSAAFEGQLTYTGDSPADDLTLDAVLVGADNQLYTISGGRVTDKTYPTTTFCKDVDEAVRQYSSLTGSATFASRSFTLTQGTAFLDFSITLLDGTEAGWSKSYTYYRAGSAVCSSDVTAENDGGNVVARFVLPVEAGDHFDHSELAIDDGGRISFGGSAEIKPKVYRVARSSRIVNLQTIAEGFMAQDGDVLTDCAENKSISIAAGASVTLSDVTISDYSHPGLTCLGSATITLVGTNSVATTHYDVLAIQAGPSGTTLEIKGDGSLTATSGSDAAGIGSRNHGKCGNITISGGTVTATGSNRGAGIGSGYEGKCGNITISGGSGTATAGSDCPFDIGPGVDSTCGTVSVASGTISGIWVLVLVECQFTVAYYLSSKVVGGIVSPSGIAYNVTPATITVSIDGKTYSSAAISPEGGNMVTATILLPSCENKTLTITSPDTPYGYTTPQSTATFSGTLSGVTISPSGTNYLGEVNLIKQ